MKQPNPKVGLLHHTGGGNLGDDASVDVVIRNIKQRWPSAEIVAFSMNPGDTVEKHGIPSLPIRRHTWDIGYESNAKLAGSAEPRQGLTHWISTTRSPIVKPFRSAFLELSFLGRTLRALRSFDFMVVSGGGQLTERSGPWGFPYAIFTWVLMAKLAGTKVIFLNVGAGPLKHPVSKFLVTRSLYAADYVSFRDEPSRDLAVSLGFRGTNHVCPDNVYNLELTATPVRPEKAGRPVVGIAPMPYPFCDPRKFPSGHQAIYEEYIAKFASFATSIAGSCNLEMFGSDVGSDPAAIADFRKTLKDSHNIATPEYDPITSVDELASRMSKMDYVVTCRFHGVVFAHLLNKPVLAISHHPKVADLMKALGLEAYCVEIRTFDPIKLKEAFEALVENQDLVRHQMAQKLASYRSQLKAQLDGLFPQEAGATPTWAGAPNQVHGPVVVPRDIV